MSQSLERRNDAERDPLPDGSELEPLIGFALESAKTLGADSAEARVGVSNALKVRVREGQVDTLQQARDHSFAVSVYLDHKTGSANCNLFERDAIRSAVEAACTIASVTSQDPCHGLADKDLLAADPIDLDLYHPWYLQPENAIEIARRCEAAGLAHDSRLVNSDGASLTTASSVACYGNSHGFLATTRGTRHGLSCILVAGDEQGMQRDYWYSTNRSADHLDSPEMIGAEAGRRAVARLGSAPVETATLPVLFEAPVARTLIGHLLAAISGSNLYRKSSFLLDRLNQPVCAPHMQISERPHLRGALGSSAFDREGVATRDRDLVTHGILQTYLLGSYAARKLGMRSTGHAGGTHNVLVNSDNSASLEVLLETLGTGLLVTELMGQGINMVTGDYSRGAAGFWIEGGKVQKPVAGVTIAGNLLDMFAGIAAIGDDVDRRTNIQTGSILIRKMTLAGD